MLNTSTCLPPGAGEAVWIGSFGTGDRRDTAGVGGSIIKPRGVFHAFWNGGVTPVRFLEVIAPGAFAGYVRELAPLIKPGGLPDLAAVTALGGRYGLEFNFASVPELLARAPALTAKRGS